MHDWMGIGLVALGLGLIVSGIMKRRSRMQAPSVAGAIRPEFAAMGEMIRPLILFAVSIFGLKMTLFYFVLGGERYLTPLDFAGVLFVLAAYSGWLVMATRRPVERADRSPVPSGERSAA
jgi:hypothetical protein